MMIFIGDYNNDDYVDDDFNWRPNFFPISEPAQGRGGNPNNLESNPVS